MKKNLIFIIIVFLSSCTAEKNQSMPEKCPNVMYAKDHQIYITSEEEELSIENISYVANINNYSFTKPCLGLENTLRSNISILFIITPQNYTQEKIVLPYYIATLNSEDKVLDIQYYSIEGLMKKEENTSNYIETELISAVPISIINKDVTTNLKNYLLIGFMLNQEKIEILN